MTNETSVEFAALLERANAGDVQAMIKVGNALRNGNKRLSVKRNFCEGVGWLAKAAAQGSVDAMRFLANAYGGLALSGTYFDVEASEKQEYWEKRIREVTASQSSEADSVLVGKGKKRIGRKTFQNRADLVHVEIAQSVQSIGCSAFENCTELESVVIPASVSVIEADAFSDCSKLLSIEIPDGVRTIPSGAFCSCKSLEHVKLPLSVEEICSGAFSGCSSLKKIDFGSKISRIGSGAFSGCASLSEVVFPDSLRTIESDAFAGCTNIVTIRFANELSELGCRAFSKCSGIREADIPKVDRVSRGAFSGCTNLHDVRFCGAVAEIDDCAFEGCCALTNIALSEGLKEIGRCAFDGCKSLLGIDIPSSVERIEGECFKGCEKLVVFDGGRTARYGESVFEGCAALPDTVVDGVLIYSATREGHVVIPTGVTRIVENAFHNESKITSIDFPDSLEVIGASAFSGCAGIKEAMLPSGMKVLGGEAFRRCESLTSVRLPAEIETLQHSLFEGCNCLTTVFPAGLEANPGCCVLPSSVKGVDGSAFKGCAFRHLTLPPDIENLENFAFTECQQLEEVEMTKLPSRVCYHVFGGCSKLKTIRIAYQAGYKDGDADLGIFKGCSIEDATIPSYLESKIDELFGEYIPPVLSFICEDGSIRPMVRDAKQEETAEDRAFFDAYGIHRYDVKCSYEKGYDFYAGCRMQSPAKESRSVVIPAKFKGGDERVLIAKIFKKGSSKTYSVRDRDSVLESYSLQRDAKASKFWPVFAGLAAYRPG